MRAGKNKNGSGSYSFSGENYNAGVCGSGHNRSSDIPQGNATYDAATANMGSPWKMFTKTQGQELIDHTTSTWTSINEVNGRKFTSKTDSSKYIFLPAGGYWLDAPHYDIGSSGYYWSSTYNESTYVWHLHFSSSSLDISSFVSSIVIN